MSARTTVDIDAVSQAIETVGREVILPRFRRLSQSEIEHKDTPGYPDDLVTVVDREAEDRLTSVLTALLPAAGVVGEEVAHADARVLSRLEGDGPVWVIDPIDGTKNFARGDDRFGIMVSLVEAGVTRAGWIVLPAQGRTFAAEAGSGARLDGEPLRVPLRTTDQMLRGTFSVRFMPAAVRDDVRVRAAGRFTAGTFSGASAIDYTNVMQGHCEFLVYYRLLPWDHAAPALILSEAGGSVEHLDGRAYTARSRSQLTIVGRDADAIAAVRDWLAGSPSDQT